MNKAKLVGGVHRDLEADTPQFHLAINRNLKSGQLDEVALNERDLLRLIIEAGQALETLRREQA